MEGEGDGEIISGEGMYMNGCHGNNTTFELSEYFTSDYFHII